MGSSRLFGPLLFIAFDGHGSQSLIGPEIQDESHALRYSLFLLYFVSW